MPRFGNPLSPQRRRFLRDTARAAGVGLQKGWQPKRSTWLWILAAVLFASGLSGVIAWELINPITMPHRGMAFDMGLLWALIAGVIVSDLLVARHGWCGHVCPVGVFYGLIGQKGLLRVSAANRTACNDCMGCYAVCSENQVISPVLKGKQGSLPLILSPNCTTVAVASISARSMCSTSPTGSTKTSSHQPIQLLRQNGAPPDPSKGVI